MTAAGMAAAGGGCRGGGDRRRHRYYGHAAAAMALWRLLVGACPMATMDVRAATHLFFFCLLDVAVHLYFQRGCLVVVVVGRSKIPTTPACGRRTAVLAAARSGRADG